MKAINVGYGNIVAASKVTAIVSPNSAPMKRLISEAKDANLVVDATQGRKTRAVIFTEGSERIILSAIQPSTLAVRMGLDVIGGDEEC